MPLGKLPYRTSVEKQVLNEPGKPPVKVLNLSIFDADGNLRSVSRVNFQTGSVADVLRQMENEAVRVMLRDATDSGMSAEDAEAAILQSLTVEVGQSAQ